MPGTCAATLNIVGSHLGANNLGSRAWVFTYRLADSEPFEADNNTTRAVVAGRGPTLQLPVLTMRGSMLAGGSDPRLYLVTRVARKQFLPVQNINPKEDHAATRVAQ